MLQFERTYNSRGKVNLTPLIDMVFLLVVFFMLSSSFVKTDVMELNFAPVNTKTTSGENKSITVRIFDNKRIAINEKKYSFSEFPSKMIRVIADHPERNIIVVAERKVSVQGLVTTMDLINLAGGRNVTIAR